MRPGKYPFMTAVNQYLAYRKGFLKESTYVENERKFRYLNKVLTDLKKRGLIRTTFPAAMSREDIQQFIIWMRGVKNTKTGEIGLDQDTQAKYMYLLNRVCLYCGNPIIQQMKDTGERLPTKVRKDLRSIEEEDLHRIQTASESIRGWRGEITRFMVWIYPYTGLRPSELRLAHVEDVDTHTWTIHVRHPKGEGSYGQKRTVPILPPARPAVVRYMKAREEYLRKKGMTSVALVPNTNKGRTNDFFSANGFYVLKAKVEKLAGVKFRIKDFRSTYAQMNLDINPNLLSDVSKFLGHATTRTTEEHYGRIKDRNAFRRLEEAWSEPSSPKVNKGVIRKNDDYTGYA